jgi:hypothetical protein
MQFLDAALRPKAIDIAGVCGDTPLETRHLPLRAFCVTFRDFHGIASEFWL